MCSPKFHFFRCLVRTVKHATNTQVCHNGDVLTAECGITGFLPWVAGKQKAKQGLDAGSRSQGLALSNSPPERPHSLESQQFLKQRHCLGTKLTLNNGRLELTPEVGLLLLFRLYPGSDTKDSSSPPGGDLGWFSPLLTIAMARSNTLSTPWKR